MIAPHRYGAEKRRDAIREDDVILTGPSRGHEIARSPAERGRSGERHGAERQQQHRDHDRITQRTPGCESRQCDNVCDYRRARAAGNETGQKHDRDE